jgi:hypothetical protein
MIWARALPLAAVLFAPAGFASAQQSSPWPDAKPAAPAASSPWPSTPSQPAAASPGASPWAAAPSQPTIPGAAAPWPSGPQGAAPRGPSAFDGGQRRDCNAEFMPLRQDAEKKAGAIKAAAAKKSQPVICNAFKTFAAAEAKMVKFVTDNGASCGIPPDATKNIKANHAKTIEIRDKVCSANPAAAAGPRTPSLSDALGTSSRLPDTSSPQTQKGGATFNTLTGNALQR